MTGLKRREVFSIQGGMDYWGEGRGKMVRGKCDLGRVWGYSLQESVSVLLSKYIYLSVFTGRQEFSLGYYLNINSEKNISGQWGKLECLGRSPPPPPPSRLNPAIFGIIVTRLSNPYLYKIITVNHMMGTNVYQRGGNFEALIDRWIMLYILQLFIAASWTLSWIIHWFYIEKQR